MKKRNKPGFIISLTGAIITVVGLILIAFNTIKINPMLISLVGLFILGVGEVISKFFKK